MHHYRCYRVWVWETRADRITDTLAWLPTKVVMPTPSSTERAIAAAHELPTSSQINIITNSQKRYHTVHDEYESRNRSFESSYWLSVFDISERSHRGYDDPSAVLTAEELLILETDRHHFLESLSTIAPGLHDFYSDRSYHSSPW